MQRRNSLAITLLVAAGIVATLAIKSPGQITPNKCPATSGSANAMMKTDDVLKQEDGRWTIIDSTSVTLTCAATPNSDGSCCRFCMRMKIYEWSDLEDTYTLVSASPASQESSAKACGSSQSYAVNGIRIEDLEDGKDYKMILSMGLYDCTIDEMVGECCRGCQDAPSSFASVDYYGTVRD